MNKQNVIDFVKTHKKVILISAGVIIGSVVLGTTGVKLYRKFNGIVKMPGFTIEGGLTVKDLGKLGEEYMKHDPCLTEDTKVVEVGKFKFN